MVSKHRGWPCILKNLEKPGKSSYKCIYTFLTSKKNYDYYRFVNLQSCTKIVFGEPLTYFLHVQMHKMALWDSIQFVAYHCIW